MAKAVLDELAAEQPRTTSPWASPTTSRTPACRSTPRFSTERPRRPAGGLLRAGQGRHRRGQQDLGQDHRRGAPTCYAQGYFVYDSKKSGRDDRVAPAVRPRPIRSTYLIDRADFVACHQFGFLDRIDVLERAAPGAHVPAQQPLPGRRGLGPLPRRGPDADHRQGPAILRGRRRPHGPRGRDGRPHQHGHADLLLRPAGVLPRDGRSRPSRRRSRRPTASAATRSCERNFAAVDARPCRPARGAGARPVADQRPATAGRRVRAGPRLRQAGHGPMLAGRATCCR